MAHLRDSALDLAIRHHAGVIVVDVNGRLTVESSPERQLVRLVRRLLDEARPWILLNLRGVPQVDSSGLSELVEAYMTTTRRGGHLKLLDVPRNVETLLHVTHLDRIFECFVAEADALASFAAPRVKNG